jgi:hypothetical protein
MLIQRTAYFISKADFTVRIVFDNDEVMLFRQLNQAATTRFAQGFPPGLPNVGTR